MTAATIAKGYSEKNAGILIATGHAIVEMPLIAAIYLGFGYLVKLPYVITVIHIAGGLMLFYLGFRMFRAAGETPGEAGGLPHSSLVTGIVLTGANPGFYVWWLALGTNLIVGGITIGNATIAGATTFGLIGILSFALVHWASDLAWCEFLSILTFKSRKWWTQKVQKIVFSICAFILIGFGVWFCVSVFF
jgi:threonine/homoserine/homoserine lactone efflux protein